jgi:hypothetical protein
MWALLFRGFASQRIQVAKRSPKDMHRIIFFIFIRQWGFMLIFWVITLDNLVGRQWQRFLKTLYFLLHSVSEKSLKCGKSHVSSVKIFFPSMKVTCAVKEKTTIWNRMYLIDCLQYFVCNRNVCSSFDLYFTYSTYCVQFNSVRKSEIKNTYSNFSFLGAFAKLQKRLLAL